MTLKRKFVLVILLLAAIAAVGLGYEVVDGKIHIV